MARNVTIHTDGASRGNPGPAAAGYVITDDKGNSLQAKAFFLGKATNNVAEYTGIVKALEAAEQIGADQLTIYSDSELLVRQINGQYRVKSEQLRPLFQQVINLLGRFNRWRLSHVARDKNTKADELANRALDREADVEDAPEGLAPNGNMIRLAVLISGGGRTLLNIFHRIKQGRLNAEIPLVISSRSTAAGVERAKNAGLDVKIIRKKDYPDLDQFSERIGKELDAADVDLVVQGGWLCLWKIPPKYEGRVMNIHPALLPGFGGKGMYGHHVHEAVLAAGCKVSGCTVHFCTNEYDKGPIIVQRCVPVQEGDTPDTLAARVFEQECIAYPQAIRLFADGRLTVKGGKVRIRQDA